MSSRLLESASEISTGFRCDNCDVLLNEVIWKRCKLCKAFDLCRECAKIPYDKLPRETLTDHQKVHPNTPITQGSFEPVSVYEAHGEGTQARSNTREIEYQRIISRNKIRNDYDLNLVMDRLRQQSLSTNDQLTSLVVNYQIEGHQRDVHVLSLDGGGVRGYMSIKVLSELITHKYLPNIDRPDPDDAQFKQSFHQAQSKFIQQFDYFVGTSTGGLIAFCLAVNYNILDVAEIYSKSPEYFKRNWTGPLINSKFDPSVIHQKIDDIIDQIIFPGNKKISSKHATLLDIRNLLNPHDIIDDKNIEVEMRRRGNTLEFVDDKSPEETPDITSAENSLHHIRREKVLLITSYNTSKNAVMIFNTSYGHHWGYRIADVLKSTMAAPTYFPPNPVYRGIQTNGHFVPGQTVEMFIDGGVFANDPALAALWAIRMQWKKPVNYHLLCVGTGGYTSSSTPSTRGGYLAWIFDNGFLISTLMEATGSFTELLSNNLAKFHNVRRIKLNYTINKPMALDDPEFVHVFKKEWEYLKNESDFKSLIYFYDRYIARQS